MLRKTITPVICLVLSCGSAWLSALAQEDVAIPHARLKTYHPAPSGFSQETLDLVASGEFSSTTPASPIKLPSFTYTVTSGRDGKTYSGVMVGGTPFNGGATSTTVPAKIIPAIVKTVALGTAVNSSGVIQVATGSTADHTTFNPVAVDNKCLTTPNNLPVAVLRQSPLFNHADFNFGGTDVGTTQGTDAFQRANFWGTINRASYHVNLSPIQLTAPTLNVAAPSNGVGGLALDLPTLIPGSCGRVALVDIGTIDNFVSKQLSTLVAQGVSPSNLPVFMFYNTAFTLGDPTNLGNCCVGGFHAAVNVGTVANPVAQTVAVVDFDMTGFFINNSGSGVLDTEIASHEFAEWMDDPLGNNPTPAWGNVGQVVGCSNVLEVGDPLSGTEAPRIAMPNGFTYHLQELAFFSWFYGADDGGAPTLGVHNWFSDDGTFLASAGPACQ
jgi:hypothetical protein